MPPSTAIVRQLSGLAALLARSNFKPDAMDQYFGPGIEVAPLADPKSGVEARGWQYWVNQNLVFTPRPDAELTAQQLRQLATYPLARTAIENSKDVICNLPRQIRAKKKPGEKNADVDKRSKGDPTLKMLNDFFDCPDTEHDWSTWCRPIIEDMLVIDAPSVLARRQRNNQISQLRTIDGAFITRLIDEWGYTPTPPQAAYQQLWSGTPSTIGGIPYVNLTTDQLIYRPRNIVPRNTVSSFLYGYSPTEQIAQEIEIGQQRLNFVLAYYTTGTIPDAMHIVPPNISSDQLNAAQKALTSEMSGQPFKRSGYIKLIQGFVDRGQPGSAGGDQIIFPKEKLLADPFDELHIRKVFYAYGASTQRIMKQMNRASAQSNQEAAEEEGTAPFAASLRDIINWIIARIFGLGFNAYELTFDAQKELDVVKRAAADKSDVDSGIITRNEARESRGMDDVEGEAGELMITTSTGVVPVSLADQVNQAKQMAATQPKPEPGGNKPVSKRKTAKIDPAKRSHSAQTRMEKALVRVFDRQREIATETAKRVLKMRKSEESEQQADQIYHALEAEWLSLPVDAREALEEAGRTGVAEAAVEIELTDAGMLSSVNRGAAEYAAKRAAEMVGMKYNAEGELVENPHAKYAISSTTRDRLREIIKNAFEEKTPLSEVIKDIQEAGIFSESRATKIAKTEISDAQVGANFDLWKASGLVTKTKWLAVGPDPCPICEVNNGEERELGAAFPSGDRYPTAHPGCYCILQAVGFKE